jgi:hypothetical protein
MTHRPGKPCRKTGTKGQPDGSAIKSKTGKPWVAKSDRKTCYAAGQMKRVLLLGIILAICILAMPQGVLAEDTRTATVDASIATYLELFTVDNPAAWELTSGTQSSGYDNIYSATSDGSVKPISIMVETNKAWDVTASDVTHPVASTGHMVSGDFILRAPMQIQQEVLTNYASLESPVLIADGDNTEIGVKTFERDLAQRVYSDDTPASYSIVITFTATNP